MAHFLKTTLWIYEGCIWIYYFFDFFFGRDFAILQSCLTCMRVQKFLEVLVLGWVTLKGICKGINLYKMMVKRKWNRSSCGIECERKWDRWGKCILDMDNGRGSQIPISRARTSPMNCSRVVQILNGRYFVDGPQYPPGNLKCIPTFKSDRLLDFPICNGQRTHFQSYHKKFLSLHEWHNLIMHIWCSVNILKMQDTHIWYRVRVDTHTHTNLRLILFEC